MIKRKKRVVFIILLVLLAITIGIFRFYPKESKNLITKKGVIENSEYAWGRWQIVQELDGNKVVFGVETWDDEDVNRPQNEDINGRITFEIDNISSDGRYRYSLGVDEIKIYHEDGQVFYENADCNNIYNFEFKIPKNGYYFCDYIYHIQVYDSVEMISYTRGYKETRDVGYVGRIDKNKPVINSLTASVNGWTNEDVVLTGNAEDNYYNENDYYNAGFGRYKFDTNSYETPNDWISAVTNTYPDEITKTYTATSAGTYYFWVRDRAQNVASKSIEVKIDKTNPTITSELKNTSKTDKSITMSIGARDELSGFSKIEWYYKKSTEDEYKLYETDQDVVLHSETAGSTSEVTKAKTIDNLEAGTYDVKAVVYDVAGNINTAISEGIVIEENEPVANIVTYNYSENGGTSVTKETDTKKNGEKIDLTVTAEKEGYKFIGWNTDRNAITALEELSMGENDITLYAIFRKDIVLQFIDYKGTSQITTTKTLELYNNKTEGTTTAPEINEYTGWTAKYWTTGEEPDSEQALASGEEMTGVTENRTYYARYSKTYTIKFDLNGGEGTVSSEIKNTAEVNSNNINDIKNTKITIPEINAVRNDYEAIGWNTKSDGTGIDYAVGEEIETINDMTLYIRWKETDDNPEEPEEPENPETNLPEIEIEKPEGWTNKNIPVKIVQTGTAKIIKVTVNGIEIQPDSNNEYSYEIEENGTYLIEVEDEANNTVRKEITVTSIDTTIPVITNIKNTTKDEIQEEVVVELNLQDNESGVAKVEYSYDGNTWNDCLDENVQKDFTVTSYSYQAGESRITMKWTEETDEIIYFRVIDRVGNISEVGETTVKLNKNDEDDNNPPTDNNDDNEQNNDNPVIDNNDDNSNINGNKDETTANEDLPKTGSMKLVFIVSISVLAIITIVFLKKYRYLKEITK